MEHTRLIEEEIARIKFYAQQKEEFVFIQNKYAIIIVAKKVLDALRKSGQALGMTFSDVPQETICSPRVSTLEEVRTLYKKFQTEG